MAKNIFTKIGNVILAVLNVILCGFAYIFKAFGWLFKNIGKIIAKFFVLIGSGVDKLLSVSFIPLFRLIKKGINKLLDSYSLLRAKLYDKSYERSKMKKEEGEKSNKVLSFIPNLLATKISYRHRQALWGVLFIIPLMIGFIYFFLFPFITTIVFSFSNVYRTTPNSYTGRVYGAVTEWVGLDNYRFVWSVHSTFKDTLLGVFTSKLLDVLMILVFSLIIAVVLNSKFRGRAFVRAVFFMPVIFNSQAVDVATSAGSTLTDAMEQSGQDVFSTMFNFGDFLLEANLPVTAVNFLTTASDSIFDVISYSGVQILIFLSGIQSVSKQLYEAAKIEGATQYEIFWKITFPMVSPLMLTAGVYTVVDSFLRSDLLRLMESYSNSGDVSYTLGLGNLTKDGVYAAMSILFVLVSLAVVAIVFLVIKRMVFYYDE